jgi:3-hydroxyisobutyrate dehydrogenase-like beta-hydroxyacid dehydrogenase
MGTALAERLIRRGFEVWGCDLDPKRVRLFRRLGGNSAPDATSIAPCCPRIVLSLPDARVVKTVLAKMRPHLKRGQIIIDTSTGDPTAAQAAGRELARRGIYYLDATISGSSSQVLRKEVIVLAGGSTAAYSACLDIFRSFARKSFWLGPSGSGSKMKLVSNLVLGLNRAALAEGLFFGTRLGLDPRTVLRILRESMAYSRIMDSKGEKMINADFTPQAKLSQHLKDVRLILAAAAVAGATLPLSRTHRRLLARAVGGGYGGLDNSAIICAFERAAPISPRQREDGD